MLQSSHFTEHSNVRPLREIDAAVGRALVQFGEMIEEGEALARMRRLPPLSNPKNEYPSHNHHAAELSLRRALRQYQKGNLTIAELGEITARCEVVLASMPSKPND